ncbi:MAG TPA: amidase family protein, partial [Anaerolineae bacterium]
MDSLIGLTLHQASEAIRTKKISAGELTDAYLARIEMLDPRLNAFITVIADQARSDARRLDEELGRGSYRGPLHGIPIA